MTRPSLQRAVADANITAEMWNDNFDDTLDYVESSSGACADKDLSNLSSTGNDKFVTKDTAQTISGAKTFTGNNTFSGTTTFSAATTFSSTVTLPSETTSTLITNVMPDFTAGVSFSSGSTTSSNGYIYVQSYTDNGTDTITIGGQTFIIGMQSGDGENKFSSFIPVYSGLYVTYTVGVQVCTFYPCKGV